MTLDFLSTPWGFGSVLIVVLLLLTVVILVARGKLRFKKTEDGAMVIGDDTPFEKTNARFKQLCQDMHKTANTIPVLTEKVTVLEKAVSVTSKDLLSLKEGFENAKEREEHIQAFILRSTIINERLPPEERMQAYDEYKKRGLNSWVDAYWEYELPGIKKLLQEGMRPRQASV